MDEIWKPVVGYEGLYEVSNLGHVDQCARIVPQKGGTNRIERVRVKTHVDFYGYERVSLTKDKIQKIIQVHRVVANSFIENSTSYPMINHKDEDKLNNTAENLEWCNNRYNVNYGTAIRRRKITLQDNWQKRKSQT